MRRARRAALVGGVSLLALVVGSGVGQARSLNSRTSVAPTVAAEQAAIAAAQQAAGAAAQAQASLARVAAALAAARNLQQNAAAAAQASSVPNGLVIGGLMPVGGTASNPSTGITGANAPQWVGANLPTQTTSGSQVEVDIQQTQPKALLYWNTFNVGSNTDVNFEQSASTWIAFNRVLDPSGVPSQIFGRINAPGSVYIINANGIIFGAGSQTNVNTLVASSLDIGALGSPLSTRDQYFLTSGIANPPNSFSFYNPKPTGYDPTASDSTFPTGVAGDITVQAGATITSHAPTDVVPLGSPGNVYLFGANVHNSGLISVPTGGEVGMVAARTVDIVPNGYSNLSHFLGAEFSISQFASSYVAVGSGSSTSPEGYPSPGSPSYLQGTGAVTHDGLIEAPGGTVIMNGDTITIDNPRSAGGNYLTDPATGAIIQGVISADTTIDRNSFVLLRAATSVTMNGVISSQPLDDGAEPLPGGQTFTPAYIEMSGQSSATVGATGLISAPSAQVVIRAIDLNAGSGHVDSSSLYQCGLCATGGALFNQGGGTLGIPSDTLSAPQTVLLAPGAVVDVAGLENVELPATYNFISFSTFGLFADMPLQRNGVLNGQTVWIDTRDSGTRSDGTSWVGTPLLDASGNVNDVGRSIYQLMTVGGSVTLQTDLTNSNGGGRVVTAGSTINVAGGGVDFLPGMVPQTLLLGSDGHIYSMANADPNLTYVGIAGQFTVDHSRWNVTDTWTTGTQIFSPGYSEGHAAGSVNVTTVDPLLTGTIFFGSVAGERQISEGQLPSQGSLSLSTPSSVQIGPTPSADYTTQSADTTVLSADTLSGYGLSALTVTANDLVVSSGSTLNLAPGGSFSVTAGGAIDIAGTVSAADGAINLVTDRVIGNNNIFPSSLFKAPTGSSGTVIPANVYVEGTLDVSGRFVNDTGLSPAAMSGPADINGGTISITTRIDSKPTPIGKHNIDETGSILLRPGSLLDVSSGGYISPQGKPKMTAGVMAGQAGSISLAIYQAQAKWDTTGQDQAQDYFIPDTGPIAVLELDGSLLGYGFQSNGSLSLTAADTIRIGGTLQPGETSSIVIGGVPTTLPVSLLAGGGFGSYSITSVSDGWSDIVNGSVSTTNVNVIVSAGTDLTLQQQNLSPSVDYRTLGTGTKLGQQATVALLPDDERKPVNLTLSSDHILLDTGSSIVTDPQASITLNDPHADPTLLGSNAFPETLAQTVDLRGSIVDHGGSIFINASETHLAAQALVDLSGTFVANSLFGQSGGPTTSGSYLNGGTFTVEAGAFIQVGIGQAVNGTFPSYSYAYAAPADTPADTNYLVADPGATVDVSGAAGTIEITGAHRSTTSQWSWSNAGTVSADVSAFAWGGSFVAMGGRYVGTDGNQHADPRANNGTIILGGGTIDLQQDTSLVAAALANFHAGQAPQALFVAADQLAPFDDVYLYAATATGGASRIFNDLTGNIYGYGTLASKNLNITGPLDWSVANRLEIAAGTIGTLAPVNAQIAAPYVLLTTPAPTGAITTLSGSSTLTVTGQTIDVGSAAFSTFARVSLISSGDIRLTTPKVANGIYASQVTSPAPTENSSFTGRIDSSGNLFFSAQRIYPVTAVDFTIQTPGSVSFTAPAGSDTSIPLAAGGGITVIAKTIDQAGNLFAPLGTITLGNTDSSVSSIITQSVTLEPGSLTSVTLADTLVPYGATIDDTNWYYNANLDPLLSSSALQSASLPSKSVVLSGGSVTQSAGATIDLRGGGDLQAMEWVQGSGGSRDTLTTTPLGQTVYALVPSQSAAIAAFDIQFATARSADGGKTVIAGDVDPLIGTQITIAGGSGIPAGTYTLYPAHYATLPGAMRVVDYGSNVGRNVPSGTTLPDGTVLVTGNYTQSTSPAKQSSGQTLFAVQTNAVWQQYSEYHFNLANSYFPQYAASQGIATPRLPMDAGQLAAIASQQIVLNGISLVQPGQDESGNIGFGAQLDVSGSQIAVLGNALYVAGDIPAGYVGVDIDQLSDFNSILIGGQRTNTNSGTMITPTASQVLVDTGGEVFSAPEILLVAKAASSSQTISGNLTVAQTNPQTGTITNQAVTVTTTVFDSGTGTVAVASGSVIETTGTVNQGSGRNYYLGPTPSDVAAALGGTLSANGTIVGANLADLNFTSTDTNKNAYNYTGPGRTALQNYAASQTAAVFVATNDTSLTVSAPAVPTPLTIQFQSSDKQLTGVTTPVTLSGSLVLPAVSTGAQLSIGSGVTISTGALTLQATATTNAISLGSNNFHAQRLNLTAPSFGLGYPPPPSLNDASKVVLYNQEFGDVGAMTLKALDGAITVYGDYNPGFNVTSLTLDAAVIEASAAGVSGSISDRGTITLQNTGAALAANSAPQAVPGTTLCIGFCVDSSGNVLGNAQVVEFGGGSQSILGYSQVNLNAIDHVDVAGAGTMTLGVTSGAGTYNTDLNVSTPSIFVQGATATGSGSFAISTLGNVSVVNSATPTGLAIRPSDSGDIGGNFSITAASIGIGSTIQAQAGTITLEATSGDVTLNQRAYLDAGGYQNTLVDVTTYVAGGKVALTADNGNVTTDPLSVIDVSQPQNGLGYGGEIDVTATSGNATLNGLLLGSGGPGLGGNFKLDIKGSADLNALASSLRAGGITGSVDIHTRTGNLTLLQNQTLKANSVTLTADDTTWVAGDPTQQFGQIFIAGTIDASGYSGTTQDATGEAGGEVSLYAANSVLLASTGVIDASTSHADQRGGDVTIGIGWGAQSKIYLQTGTHINVSGGNAGGTVTFNAPRDGNNDMLIAGLSAVQSTDSQGNPVGFAELPTIDGSNVTITGARSVSFDGFVAFDTQQSAYGLNGSSLGWTGRIDPAGWYNTDGTVATSGTWTNIQGWTWAPLPTTNPTTGFTAVPTAVSISGGTGATLGDFVMGVNAFRTQATPAAGLSPGTYTVTFSPPVDANGNPVAGGVAAQGTVTITATGTFSSISITNPGSGYTAPASYATITNGQITQTLTPGGGLGTPSNLKIVSAQITNLGSGYTASATPTATVTQQIRPGNTASETISFQLGASFSGSESLVNNTPTFTPATSNFIPLASSGVLSAFTPATQGASAVTTVGSTSVTIFTATFTGGAGTDSAFFGTTLAQVAQGTWTNGNSSYGFGNLFTKIAPLVSDLGGSIVHVQPGIQLVNSSTSINNGDITVENNWNLAAGTAQNLQTTTYTLGKAAGTSYQYYDPNQSYVNFLYRLSTPWGGIDAGALTLRAAGNINVDASISDGFFQFGNYLDPNYVSAVNAYITNVDSGSSRVIDGTGGLYESYLNDYSSTTAVPIAPYSAAANSISPSSPALAAADLFPHSLNVGCAGCTVVDPSSWSYNFTAGADLASANPTARIPLGNAVDNLTGNVIVNSNSAAPSYNSYSQTLINQISGPTSVTVNLPTMVRTGTGDIAISAAADVVMANTTTPGVIYAAGVNAAPLPDPGYNVSAGVVTATDPSGFFAPQVLAYGNGAIKVGGGAGLYDGPPTAAAFPEDGGDVRVDAQRDVVGYTGTGNKAPQYFQQWLLSDSGVTPGSSAGASVTDFGQGVFTPSGMQIASQSAWWIEYGSFDQGILSAGGDVTVTAGRNLVDVSVSLPTTGRVSGGLSATSTPVTHIYGSGNMVVRAGGDILGGSFYEGSGDATIMARGTIGQNGTVSRFASSKLQLPDYPLLAVDTGQIDMMALGSIAISGVVNPAELHAQQPNFANPLDSGSGGAASLPLYMDTYGPDSKVRLVAANGGVTISVAPTAITDETGSIPVDAAASLYPASFEALALGGSLTTTGIAQITQVTAFVPTPGIVLSESEQGTFELLAQDNVDLSFAYPMTGTVLINTPVPVISAGPALIDAAFDPYQPNSGFDQPFTTTLLAHQNDAADGLDTTARIYAATGTITGVGSYKSGTYYRTAINRPTKVYAGLDIKDLNIIVQNIATSDVSSIEAGRNIFYTGLNNGGGIQVAGPGYLVVQAGGNIGPFLPAAYDNSTQAPVQEGIASVGNSSATPVGDNYVLSTTGGGSVGIYDQALLGPIKNPRRNTALTAAAGTARGASIIALFGTEFGIDYQAMIDAYIDPANAANVDHNYIGELQAFLSNIGMPASASDAATVFAAFNNLPADLQHVFVDQVFFAELKAVGIEKQSGTTDYPRGYEAINTMFPSSLGYTANALGGGTNGANQTVKTGNLDLLHATVQTQLGGDISIFGPGGNINVGSLATEPNPKLGLRDLGILTLGGGNINTFTDGSVAVNSSRVLTTQGGDVLMWSSNGDLDAGRGSKTTFSSPPLQVEFDQNDYEYIDLGGFVTGSGIGTLQASDVAAASNVYLLAPRGTINAGNAGIRSSGTVVAVAPVIVNPANISATNGVVGVPVISVPNVGALAAGSNTAGAAAKTAEAPTASGGDQNNPASVFIVEVVGYGGGDQSEPSSDTQAQPGTDSSEKKKQ